MIENDIADRLSVFLPGAHLENTVLPQCNAISLYLLNRDYTQHKMSEKQFQRLMEEPLYWIFCWASGQAMVRFLLNHSEWVAGKRVLDFGCGSGVVAIAAAKAGAAKVWASDIDPLATQATRMNGHLNSVSIEVIGDWTVCTEPLDLILAADVLYDKANLAYLDQFLERAPEVLVADSRVKTFDHPPYRKIGQLQSFTIPDLAEPDEFGHVCFYHAKNDWVANKG
ncbi:methyltransferase [Desulfosarcina ovata subsp. sediminis]|uniref:Methyltransferase n=1 Tax=Desulfosarcina ovata subsp. sediminis TaxID=885957 RepID=A0A5K7ZL73_9BACT|nr:50S ribosomal protein L11 methyltransferase [Desulfosarcina ovata]BBO80747.1 methyltransferase [Desulfosarcina ovata subsp. sediminis]